MIIRHSLHLLEQLTKIERLIARIEDTMDKTGIEVDREKLLMKLIKTQEAKNASLLSKN